MGIVGEGKRIARSLARRTIGIDCFDENMDTLFYFLNEFVDIETVPEAVGSLRKLQLCNLEVLRIFDNICRKRNLRYWLDYGTLLGAKRHGGFIPWDDDLDVCMPRSDFEEACRIIPKLLKKYGFYVTVVNPSWMGVGYKRDETGLWLDVFCFESSFILSDLGNDSELDLRNSTRKYMKYCAKHFGTKKWVGPQFSKAMLRKEKLFSRFAVRREPAEEVYYLSPEFLDKDSFNLHKYNDIFPLVEMSFENCLFFAPRNTEQHLKSEYGDYMTFPRGGILHHSLKEGSLKDIASLNGVDMDEVGLELKLIERQME